MMMKKIMMKMKINKMKMMKMKKMKTYQNIINLKIKMKKIIFKLTLLMKMRVKLKNL